MTAREIRVERVRDLGPQFTDNPHRMVGQDGAFSIPLDPGRALWFFGDTFVGRRTPGESLWYPGGKPVSHRDMSGVGGLERMINTTAMIVTDRSGREGIQHYRYILDAGGGLKQIIPALADEHPDWVRVWCLHGCMLGGRIYLYFITVTMLDAGEPLPVMFNLRGAGLAVGSETDWNFRRLEHNGTTLWWGADLPQFGTTVLRDQEKGYVYVYGVKKGPAGEQLCHLARVREDEIERLEGYEYLSSARPEWSSDVRQAVPVMDGMPNEMSVSWNDYLGAYLAVHSVAMTGDIVGRTAPTPWGPWSDPALLWRVEVHRERPLPYTPLIYAGKEHPELAEEGGRVLYLTYIEFEEYYPHLIEVRLAQR